MDFRNRKKCFQPESALGKTMDFLIGLGSNEEGEIMMGFEEEYQSFLDYHLGARKGERLRRLQEGHLQAEKMFLEKVWWPLFHNFEQLHPEYEVHDFKDGQRYLDFAYLRPSIKICFEIDGYGPHIKQMSRWQFSDSLERQNQLMIDGWKVIRFSYDQVNEHPRRCQQVTQQMISMMLGHGFGQLQLSIVEREIVRFALNHGNTFSPGDIRGLLKVSQKTAKKILSGMVEKKVIHPELGKKRIHRYRLVDEIRNPFL